MKHTILFLFFTLIAIAACTKTSEPNSFPAEDCFINYNIGGDLYRADSLAFTVIPESDLLNIYYQFDDGGSLQIFLHDWPEKVGEYEVTYLIYNKDHALYSLDEGPLVVTELTKDVIKATFADGEGYITNGEFVLRYFSI